MIDHDGRPDEKIETFVRKNGKVLSKWKPRYVPSKTKPNFKSNLAKSRINSMLSQMKYEIDQSQKGSRNIKGYGIDQIVWADKSTFPKFLRETKINTRKDFNKVINRRKGIRFERLKKEAINRLNDGFQNDHGYDMPDMEFKVKTKQVHDNKDVIFRRIKGRIVPIRVSKRNRHDLLEEAPF